MQELVPEEQAHAVSAVSPSSMNKAGASAVDTPIPSVSQRPPRWEVKPGGMGWLGLARASSHRTPAHIGNF